MMKQGRMLFDVFIHRQGSDTFLIDHQKRCTTPLTTHLKRHIIRSKVTLQDVSSDFGLFQAWNPFAAFNLPEELLANLNGAQDNRTPSMGFRFLNNESSLKLDEGVEEVNEDFYKLHRLRLGVPEGIEDLAPLHALPLESNIDYMGGSAVSPLLLRHL